MKIMVAGDLHGNTKFAQHVIVKAVENKAEAIIQVGDWGIFPARYDTVEFLDTLNYDLRDANRHLIFIRGNHDDPGYLNFFQGYAKSTSGHAYIRSHILFSPDRNMWKWNGKRFMTVGGAVSVDKGWRIDLKRRTGEDVWWEDEEFSERELNKLLACDLPPVDFLFTHDCSDATPFKDRLKPDLDSKIHRQRIDKILDHVKPAWQFHGHFHQRYEWDYPIVGEPHTKVRGLACDGCSDAWGILDTDNDTFKFDKEIDNET